MPACSFFCQALQKYIEGRSDIKFLGEPQPAICLVLTIWILMINEDVSTRSKEASGF